MSKLKKILDGVQKAAAVINNQESVVLLVKAEIVRV